METILEGRAERREPPGPEAREEQRDALDVEDRVVMRHRGRKDGARLRGGARDLGDERDPAEARGDGKRHRRDGRAAHA